MLDDEVRMEGNAQEPQGEGLLVLERAVQEGSSTPPLAGLNIIEQDVSSLKEEERSCLGKD